MCGSTVVREEALSGCVSIVLVPASAGAFLPRTSIRHEDLKLKSVRDCKIRFASVSSFEIQSSTTFSGGCLGSHNDEERSEMRYVMRIARPRESLRF